MYKMNFYFLLSFLVTAFNCDQLKAVAITNLCDAIEDKFDELQMSCDPSENLCSSIYNRRENAEKAFNRQCHRGLYERWDGECRALKDQVLFLNRMAYNCGACIRGEGTWKCDSLRELENLIGPEINEMCDRDQRARNQCSEICDKAKSFSCK